jgi:hypothetical protein
MELAEKEVLPRHRPVFGCPEVLLTILNPPVEAINPREKGSVYELSLYVSSQFKLLNLCLF